MAIEDLETKYELLELWKSIKLRHETLLLEMNNLLLLLNEIKSNENYDSYATAIQKNKVDTIINKINDFIS